jgi:hypothetical protein
MVVVVPCRNASQCRRFDIGITHALYMQSLFDRGQSGRPTTPMLSRTVVGSLKADSPLAAEAMIRVVAQSECAKLGARMR